MKNSVVRMILSLLLIGSVAAGSVSCAAPAERPPGSTLTVKDEAFVVLPLQTVPVAIGMEEGEILRGTVGVAGGEDDIKIYVRDDFGNMVLDLGVITGTYAFSYVAVKSGYYTIYFDNSNSVSVNKEIKLHYEVR